MTESEATSETSSRASVLLVYVRELHPIGATDFLCCPSIPVPYFERMIPREVFRQIRRLEIRTRGLVDSFMGGEYHSAFKGRGMSFAEVRPYQIGDDVRSIDWNVSARLGTPFIKVFEEEREQTILLLVDISASEAFGTRKRTKRELAAEVCALIGFSAAQNIDRIGLTLFADQIERFVPPSKGRTHVLRLVRDLYVHEAESTGTDLRCALEHASRILKRRAIVLVLSDFLADGYQQALRALSSKHDVVALHLIDPAEEALPSVGLLTLIDAETGMPYVVDSSSRAARERFAERSTARMLAAQDAFTKARVDVVPLRTDEDHVVALESFFRRRTRARGL